jgi:hypothetical protein
MYCEEITTAQLVVITDVVNDRLMSEMIAI